MVVTLSLYSYLLGCCFSPGGVCVLGGGLGSLGHPISLVQSSGRTYSEEGLSRRHLHLVLALPLTKDEGSANATPSQT